MLWFSLEIKFRSRKYFESCGERERKGGTKVLRVNGSEGFFRFLLKYFPLIGTTDDRESIIYFGKVSYFLHFASPHPSSLTLSNKSLIC